MSSTKLHRTAGRQFRDCTLGGKSYRLRNLILEDYADMESRVVAGRPDPFEVAAKAIAKVPAAFHDKIWDSAMRSARSARSATVEELTAWGQSESGIAFTFWRCARQEHPEIDSEEKALAILKSANPEELAGFVVALKVGSGEADLKNSDGPEAPVPGAAKETPESSPGGPSSTGGSPNSIPGALTSSTA